MHAKAKFRRRLNPGALLTILPKYSLHNRLLESPDLLFGYVMSAISGMIIGYSLLKFHWEKKNSESTRWTIGCSQLISFGVSDPKEIFFLYG